MGLLDAAANLLVPPTPDPVIGPTRQITTLSLAWVDKKSGEAQFVRFDAVTSETHESLMSITDHPVEEGVDVTDNARPEPDRLTIEGYVSNKPLLSNPGVEKFAAFKSVDLNVPDVPTRILPTPGSITRTVTNAIDNALNPPKRKATLLAPSGQYPDRAKAMFKLLKDAQRGAQRIIVSTTFEQLENMMIERLTVPRTTADGNGATFQIELKRVRIAKSETVSAPDPAEARGALAVAKGSKAAQAADAKNQEKLKSIAAGLFDKSASALGSVASLFGG